MANNSAIEQITEGLSALMADNAALREDLQSVRAQIAFEDSGWKKILGTGDGEKVEGLSLSELKDIVATIRPFVAGGGLVKRGCDLHAGYVWSKNVNIEGVFPTFVNGETKKGRPSNLTKIFNNPINQESLFSSAAHEELQKERYIVGNVILVADKATGTVRRIPFDQIEDVLVNPDFPEEIWAYKRTWTPTGDKKDSRSLWYYTLRADEKKVRTVKNRPEFKDTPVAEEIIIDRRFNRQVGYTFGVPDVAAAMPWIAAYEEIMNNGRVVTESLAMILYKITSPTANGAKNVAARLANSEIGGAATMAEGTDVQAIQTAGKGYDFTQARPVAAMAAAALNVPNMEFLSDTSAAGSSYGAAAALTMAVKNAMRLMQSQWIELYQEVFDYLAKTRPRIWFDPLEDVDRYRESQTIKLLSETLTDEEYRQVSLDLLDIPGDATDIPKLLKMRSEVNQPNNSAKQAAAPDQGRSNGTGGVSDADKKDNRSDTISSSEALLPVMQMETLMDRMAEMTARIEALSNP